MADKTFAFVILHYNEIQVTKTCIEMIKKNTAKESVSIVIVDNASPDGSGKQLQTWYRDDSQITVLLADKNLGFAKGNNLGYTYARETLHADFMCMMNNDVLLIQPDFIKRIYEEYEQSVCGIIGPHITLLNGMTNYMYLKLHSKEYYENERKMSQTMYRYYTSRLFPVRNVINRMLDKLVPAFKIHKAPKETLEDRINMVVASKKRHHNIVLHGCCLILTPNYIDRFDTAFDDRTFMFREEELLYLRCRKHDIETVYEPSIDILHLEDMSTNATYKKNNKREAFKYQCQIDSLKILLEELE